MKGTYELSSGEGHSVLKLSGYIQNSDNSIELKRALKSEADLRSKLHLLTQIEKKQENQIEDLRSKNTRMEVAAATNSALEDRLKWQEQELTRMRNLVENRDPPRCPVLEAENTALQKKIVLMEASQQIFKNQEEELCRIQSRLEYSEAPCTRCPDLISQLTLAKGSTNEIFGAHRSIQTILCAKEKELATLYSECGNLKAENALFKPCYLRAQESLSKNSNAVTGANGENRVYDSIRAHLGSHASISNDNSKGSDLCISWKFFDDQPPLKVTVEVKTCCEDKQAVIAPSWVDQAAQQVMAEEADAGILFFSHQVSSGASIKVDRASRVVQCGDYNSPGQIMVALVLALGQAYVHRFEKNQNRTVLSSGDLSRVANINGDLVNQIGHLRKGVNEAKRTLESAFKYTKEDTKAAYNRIVELNPAAAKLYPGNMQEILRTPRESWGNSSQKKRKVFSCFGK